MRILLVAATEAEAPPVVAKAGHTVKVLITGVGMVATAARCAQALAGERYDLAINVGLCGSFNPKLSPGTVVHVASDRLPELGAQDGDAFLTIHDMNLLGQDEFPFEGGMLVNAVPPMIRAITGLPSVAGITVNTVHGNTGAIARIVERLNPDVESMEGAAFMYACLIHDVPFAQVRAVSNVVERRNRPAWKIGEALSALAAVTRDIVSQA
jgi:futalosine hydrolase